MNYANLSTNCTKITVFVASFNACMSLFHIPLLEGDAPLVLISGWMRQLKNSSFCLGKTDWKLRHVCCYNFCSEAEKWFFSVIARLQLNCGLFLIFVSMTCSENLLDQISLIDRALTSNAHLCPSLSRNMYAFGAFFPLFHSTIFFLFWKNI